ncbi:PTS sugar transporter subunit IIA, partial [Bacillus sp. S34]|nr:PTS sugar transporter subunit IIA [Bacillus sp. S34]
VRVRPAVAVRDRVRERDRAAGTRRQGDLQALAVADAVVVLCDLGSAYLTTDTALDFLDDDARARVHVSQAPL